MVATFFIYPKKYSIVFDKYHVADASKIKIGCLWSRGKNTELTSLAVLALSSGINLGSEGQNILGIAAASGSLLLPRLYDSFAGAINSTKLAARYLKRYNYDLGNDLLLTWSEHKKCELRHKQKLLTTFISWKQALKENKDAIVGDGFEIRRTSKGSQKLIQGVSIVRNDTYEISIDENKWKGDNALVPVLLAYILRSFIYVSPAALIPLSLGGSVIAAQELKKYVDAHRASQTIKAAHLKQ
jgi:hypothetical protein